VRVFPDKPITKKPQETRMGKGKGAPEEWVCVIRPGRVLFEMEGVTEAEAREAFALAAAIARRDGRDGVGCLVQLGGDDVSARRDAQAAARARGFIGFGVEPSLMRADVQAWRAGWMTWDGLVAHVAARYCALIDVFAPRDRFATPPTTLQAHG